MTLNKCCQEVIRINKGHIFDKDEHLICASCGTDLSDLMCRGEQYHTLKKKLEQREKFIDDIFIELKNSNSKSTIVNVLLTRCKEQINGQKLGVL